MRPLLNPQPERFAIAEQAGTVEGRNAAGVGEEQDDVLCLSRLRRLGGARLGSRRRGMLRLGMAQGRGQQGRGKEGRGKATPNITHSSAPGIRRDVEG